MLWASLCWLQRLQSQLQGQLLTHKWRFWELESGACVLIFKRCIYMGSGESGCGRGELGSGSREEKCSRARRKVA